MKFNQEKLSAAEKERQSKGECLVSKIKQAFKET
jgi:hypothetical protein